MNEILLQAEQLRRDLTEAVEADAAAFTNVLNAFKLPHGSEEQEKRRAEAIQQTCLHAAQVPLSVAQKAVTVMTLAERCAALGNLNAISDAASASALALAALTSAGYNVRINVNGLSEKIAGDGLLNQLQALEASARELENEVHKTLTERAGLYTE
jgi:formiminotetrahydrofolate cyclodeaminase